MNEDIHTEAAAVEDIAIRAAEHQQLDPNELHSVVLPVGYSQKVLDLEGYLDRPERLRGSTNLHDADSFIRLVAEHEGSFTHVYASQEDVEFVGVFNDPTGGADGSTGWADHRALLRLQHTPEWLHWAGRDGKMLTQATFAEHIEDGLLEIVEPNAAEMLELAQTFHAHTGVQFKSSQLLDSGERQFVYEEAQTTRAGRDGKITVPKEFVLAIKPFDGSDLYKVRARLRHRAREGSLELGYRLDRPHDVIRTAFDDTVSKIDEAITSEVLRGTPPTGVGR